MNSAVAGSPTGGLSVGVEGVDGSAPDEPQAPSAIVMTEARRRRPDRAILARVRSAWASGLVVVRMMNAIAFSRAVTATYRSRAHRSRNCGLDALDHGRRRSSGGI